MDFLEEYRDKLNEMKILYPSLAKFGDLWLLDSYNQLQEEQILKEFITQTIDYNKTEKEFNKRFKEENILINRDDFNKDQIIIYFKDNSINNFDIINKFLDSFGYFPAYISGVGKYNNENLNNIKNNKNIKIRFESKYDKEVNNINQNLLIHLVPDIYWKHIKLKGLTPKSKSKISSHPERIYLLETPLNIDELEDIALTLFNKSDNEIKKYIKNYYVLYIDIEELKNNTKFYEDPNFRMGNGAVWTYKNIPPKYIELGEEILVNPHGNDFKK